MPTGTICLWFERDAEAAAEFYAATFPDSRVTAVHRAPADNPSGRAGDVLTVEFTVAGIPCLGLNGGPTFALTEAFSFQITTEDQEETDRYGDAIVGNGGQESQCGWCRDRWGVSWQGLLFIGVGRMLRTARRNYFIGIRTPWTLASDEVWRATHALGARTFTVGGIVAVAAGFLGEAGFWLMMAVLIGAALVPVVYSYVLWRRLGRPAPTP